jgi:hypothetical protein
MFYRVGRFYRYGGMGCVTGGGGKSQTPFFCNVTDGVTCNATTITATVRTALQAKVQRNGQRCNELFWMSKNVKFSGGKNNGLKARKGNSHADYNGFNSTRSSGKTWHYFLPSVFPVIFSNELLKNVEAQNADASRWNRMKSDEIGWNRMKDWKGLLLTNVKVVSRIGLDGLIA